MTRIDDRVVVKRQYLARYRIYQLIIIAARQIGPPDRPLEQSVADKDMFAVNLGKYDMSARMSRAMPDRKAEVADIVQLAVLPIAGERRRPVIGKAEGCQLALRDAHHQWLLRQAVIEIFVILVK